MFLARDLFTFCGSIFNRAPDADAGRDVTGTQNGRVDRRTRSMDRYTVSGARREFFSGGGLELEKFRTDRAGTKRNDVIVFN